MKTIVRYILIFLLISFTKLIGQTNEQLDILIETYGSQIDDTSKVKTAAAIFEEYYKLNPTKGLVFAKDGFLLAEKLGFEKGIAVSLLQQGKYFKLLRKNDSAEYYLKLASRKFEALKDHKSKDMVSFHLLKVASQKGNHQQVLNEVNEKIDYHTNIKKDSFLIARYLDLKASTYRHLTEYDKGFKSAFDALKIAKNLDDKQLLLDCYTTISNLYHYIIDDENADLYAEKALKIAKEGKFMRAEANLLNNLGNSFFFQKRYEESLTSLKKSLKISERIEANDLISITNFNIGKLYVEQNELNKGVDFLKQSITHSRTVTKNPVYLVWGLNGLTNAYNKLSEPQRAITLADEAIKISDSTGNLDDLSLAYYQRYESYGLLKDYQKALEDLKLHKGINDSVYNISKSKEIQRLTTEFETKEKEQQIALQENEIRVLEQKEEISTLQKIVLGGLLIMSLFGFYGIHQRLKRSKLEKEKINAQLAFKKKELTTHALHLAKKNEVLAGLKQKAAELIDEDGSKNGYIQLIRTINFDLQDDNNWENFARYFEEVHKDFNSNVKSKYPQLTSNELRLLALLKMNLSSKEIANILNISQEGIKKARYRLRKKLDITSEDSLQDLVLSL
ncbi:tetratricopeptide repeat protein [Croceivirga thetidis]|uniref:Tetratricopeptide repeat protein n=1 Tax=Croceivirga thetidis TaxID=2721623 RepID=A0ABX1GS83_9FLAO|nr:tetratricopeptide repeat protein [Croceivirga thetidis]NKI32493.1 tetratricopeptide repeat protein [Croceivirga thetidis]